MALFHEPELNVGAKHLHRFFSQFDPCSNASPVRNIKIPQRWDEKWMGEWEKGGKQRELKLKQPSNVFFAEGNYEGVSV